MAEYSAGLVALAERLQAKSADLEPQLQEIGKLEGQVPSGGMRVGSHTAPRWHHTAQVQQLEGAVQQLDSYSRSLEAKFRTLENT